MGGKDELMKFAAWKPVVEWITQHSVSIAEVFKDRIIERIEPPTDQVCEEIFQRMFPYGLPTAG